MACVWRRLVVIEEPALIFVSCCQHKSFLRHAVLFTFIIKLFFSNSLMLTHRSCLQAFQTFSPVTCNKASTEKHMRNYFKLLNIINPSTEEVTVSLYQDSKGYFQKNMPFALSSRNGGCLLCWWFVLTCCMYQTLNFLFEKKMYFEVFMLFFCCYMWPSPYVNNLD